MDDDNQNLQLLEIGHYVVAGLTALSACAPLVFGVLHLLFMSKIPGPRGDADSMFQFMAVAVVVIVGLASLGGWAVAICVFLAGRFLAERRRYNFCFVVAAVMCICFPLGTLLGIATIVVLSKPTVKELFFEAAEYAPVGSK